MSAAGIQTAEQFIAVISVPAMSGAILENKDTKEIDIILEGDGKLYPIEAKKTATPASQLTRVFNVIDKPPLVRSTSAILCTCDKFSAFDSDNLIVPVWMI